MEKKNAFLALSHEEFDILQELNARAQFPHHVKKASLECLQECLAEGGERGTPAPQVASSTSQSPHAAPYPTNIS